MRKILIRTIEDLEDIINQWGFLPFFRGRIPGFSIEEVADPAIWYEDGDFRVWDWKGPAIQDLRCAYGKFFEKKAAFISREWFYDFANYRRDGYDYEGFFNDEKAISIRAYPEEKDSKGLELYADGSVSVKELYVASMSSIFD